MNLENQVCSLEPSKRLRELGVPQESLFYWGNYGNQTVIFSKAEWGEYIGKWEKSSISNAKEIASGLVSAFTVAELGEMLPDFVDGYKWIEIGRYDNQWVIQYQKKDNELMPIRKEAETEADAAAASLHSPVAQNATAILQRQPEGSNKPQSCSGWPG